jgi:hypothetical protein
LGTGVVAVVVAELGVHERNLLMIATLFAVFSPKQTERDATFCKFAVDPLAVGDGARIRGLLRTFGEENVEKLGVGHIIGQWPYDFILTGTD